MHTLYLHYTIVSMIMDELGVSIHCKDIDELIGWWELRKFYKNCVVPVYFASLDLIVGGLLIVCASLVIMIFSRIIIDNKIDLDNIIIAIWTSYFVAFTFLMLLNAANYNANQLSHVHMITKESMALQRYAFDSNSTNDEKMHYIVDRMKDDIQENSHAMRAFGIKIDATLMVVLRASIGTIGVA
eukprot:344960_1